MRYLFFTFLLLSYTQDAHATNNNSTQIELSVEGMTCSFCAKTIEKKLQEQESVNTVKVDLEKKLVFIDLKPNKNMSDKELTHLIKELDFKVTNINRIKPS